MLLCILSTIDEGKKRDKIEIDEMLFQQIAESDVGAFEELYIKTNHAIYGFILSIMKNQQDTEDIMQDTYIKIRNSAHLYEAYGKPLAWMFTIARNLCLMKIRSEKKSSFMNYDDLENRMDFANVQNKDDKLVLEVAFKILTDEERQIIMLHAISGMKHREIAEILNLPLSTVLSKYKRSISKLRKNIEGDE